MNQYENVVAHGASSAPSVVSTNKVIKNTYMLLSATLIFSAIMAGLSMFLKVPPLMHLVALGGSIVLIWFVLPKTANSSTGLWVVFGITGLMGFGLGPILSMYASLPKGPEIIATAFGGTGVIFLGLSGYALTTRKDFSFMGGFLIAGLILALVASLANIFLAMPALSLAVSAVIMLLMSGFILYDTSRMIHDPNVNYIMMTVSMYLSIYNLFLSLLQILGVLGDE